jgi:predicted RNA binding protein YcfA (HicA-like mRNA interferase family)
MPRVPRDISGQTLVKLLSHYGYKITRQIGSHIRLTSNAHDKEHHITVPNHDYVKIGTLNSILNDLADFLGKSKEGVVKDLF